MTESLTPMNHSLFFVTVSLCFALAACGGGGGGSAAPKTSGSIVLPTDSSTVTNTQSNPVRYSTITELSTSGALVLTNGISQQIVFTSNSSGITTLADTSSTSGTATMEVTYDSSKKPTAYKLDTNKGLSFSMLPEFYGTKLSTAFIFSAAPTGSDKVDAATSDLSNFVALANAYDLNWNYQTYGIWVSGFKDGNAGRAAAASFGSPTASISSTSGTANYSGLLNGAYIDNSGKSWITHGTLSATADFSAKSLAVSASDTKGTGVTDRLMPLSDPSRLNFSGNFTWTGSTNSLSGTLSTAGSALSGPAQARFFGPDSGTGGPAEVGGTFFLSGSDVERYIGAFGAKR